MNETLAEAMVSIALTATIWFVMYFLLRKAHHATHAQSDWLWQHRILQEALVREQIEQLYQPLATLLRASRSALGQPAVAMTRRDLEASVSTVDPLFFSRLEEIKALFLQHMHLLDNTTVLGCAQAFLNCLSAWNHCSLQETCGKLQLSGLLMQIQHLDQQVHLELHNLQRFHHALVAIYAVPDEQDAFARHPVAPGYAFWDTLHRKKEGRESTFTCNEASV